MSSETAAMPENPEEQYRVFRYHIFWETLKRGLRTCALYRPLLNLWLALRHRSVIHPLACIDWNVHLGRRCFIGRSDLNTLGGHGRIEVGDGSIIYSGCDLLAHHGSAIRIGRNVLFTRQAAAITGGHKFDDPDTPIARQGIAVGDITIEDDCWIGYRSVVLYGVRIGRGSVVASGAVVTKDLPPMSVAGGVPARVLRTRGEPAGTEAPGL